MRLCAKCGNEINDDAAVCTKCGFKAESAHSSNSKQSKKPIYKKWWFWVIIVLALVVIGSAMGTSEDDVDITTTTTVGALNTTTTTSSSSNENIYSVGEVLSANGLEITYQSCEKWTGYNEYLGPKDGYEIIRVYFVIENTSNTDRSSGTYDFKCYADGVAIDSYFYGDNQLSVIDTISSGRKMQGYIYYEVPVGAEVIEIEYETSYWTNKKAIFVVEVD